MNIAGNTRFDEESKNDIIETFDRVYDKFVANDIPVIIGELGLLGFDTDINAIQQGEKLKSFEYMFHYAKEKQLTHMLWDNGQHFGRESFEWSNQALYNMMKSSWETRSATAESDFIYLKKDVEIQDMEINLNLNGNEFVSLNSDDTELKPGQDYDLNGNILTVKANLLEELTTSGKTGVNAVLTAKFNQGVDWHFDVITYETPILDNAEGTTSNFTIPTLFNGDNLATMEAVYDDGSFAGPQNWTSYKEFAYTFSPSYDTNEIILKENFFNEVNDGNVNLTFHFWSGEVLSYTITKDGENVLGIYEVDTPTEPGDSEDLVEIDVSELEKIIKTAESFANDNSKYTEESFNALLNAITKAQAALETILSEGDLNSEVISLQAAIDGLNEVESPKDKENISDSDSDSDVEEDEEITMASDSKPDIDKNGTSDVEGESLPKTATSMYTILLAGLVLLVLGTVTLIFIKKRRSE